MEENAYIDVDEATLKNVDEKMPPEEELQDLADFFKVFGDATRLKILYVLLNSKPELVQMTRNQYFVKKR